MCYQQQKNLPPQYSVLTVLELTEVFFALLLLFALLTGDLSIFFFTSRLVFLSFVVFLIIFAGVGGGGEHSLSVLLPLSD